MPGHPGGWTENETNEHSITFNNNTMKEQEENISWAYWFLMLLIVLAMLTSACDLIGQADEGPRAPADGWCDKFIFSVYFMDGQTCRILWGVDPAEAESWVDCPYEVGVGLVRDGEGKEWPFVVRCD